MRTELTSTDFGVPWRHPVDFVENTIYIETPTADEAMKYYLIRMGDDFLHISPIGVLTLIRWSEMKSSVWADKRFVPFHGRLNISLIQ